MCFFFFLLSDDLNMMLGDIAQPNCAGICCIHCMRISPCLWVGDYHLSIRLCAFFLSLQKAYNNRVTARIFLFIYFSFR